MPFTTTRGVGAAERCAALCAPETGAAAGDTCRGGFGRGARRWAAVAAARASAAASRSAIAARRAEDACSTARRSARASTKPTNPERRLMTHRRRRRPKRSARPPHACGTREPRGARTRGARHAADAATPAPADRPRAGGGSPRRHARGERRARARHPRRGSTAHARALGTPGTTTRLHATARRGRGAARHSRCHHPSTPHALAAGTRASDADPTEARHADGCCMSGARHRERRRQHRRGSNASVHDLDRHRLTLDPATGRSSRSAQLPPQPFLDSAHRDAGQSTNHDFLLR